jgi:hypothetical protein
MSRAGPDHRATWFDFAAGDARLGGSVRLARDIGAGRAVYWACIVGDGRPLVTVRDDDVPLPRGSTLEVRTSGLWSAIHTETPGEHWSVGLEAFALALDDPYDAWADERGDLVPLGFDLEWEATTTGGLSTPCVVTGEVLLGDEVITVDAFGWRGDEHGPHDWTTPKRTGHWADGTPLGRTEHEAVFTPVHEAPVLAGAGDVRLARSLCLITEGRIPEGRIPEGRIPEGRITESGGRTGAGWWERVHPVEGELVE